MGLSLIQLFFSVGAFQNILRDYKDGEREMRVGREV